MSRKLASIRTISSIEPIEGKDRIGLAMVDGWQVIVQKSQFNVGDLCVYIEIDSVLPETEQFEFLRKHNFRIKTMKMGGVISQGICFPLSILPNSASSYKLGDDVTEVLKIKQYEATMDIETEEGNTTYKKIKYPAWLMRFAWFRRLVTPNKKVDSSFPSFIHKTDEVRIQDIPHVLKDKSPMIVTEKIDGQSGTFCFVPKSKTSKRDFIVCSRNRRIPIPDNSSYWSVSKLYKLETVLSEMIKEIEGAEWIAIQGECIGPKIQKNKYNYSKYDLFVFNVITNKGRIGSLEAKDLCESYGLRFVPIVADNYVLPDSVNDLLKFAHGTSELYNTLREGLVIRSKDGQRSFKAVDPIFLMQHDE